ncbi:PREDICTED: plasticin [Nicrophorus vespilloides]|uniref:Plasticin n=1 Tax=Nicrophorus vespilloides TaxID=110193 RepID=A0ABM1MAD0_NICVS|nr:PREDICTED: plasticin [Nicrophorus vespilloides]
MSLMNRSTLGGGDGIRGKVGSGGATGSPPRSVPKKRTPVPSSRRFATRGATPSTPGLKERLREAIETYSTPPQSPLRRRSLTVAEITPTRTKSSIKLASPSSDQEENGVRRLQKATGRRVGGAGVVGRTADAGHRVSHQLVLNAWRRRRRQVAALTDSRDQLQTQMEQLKMQVDVLQKLRVSEAGRRGEAVAECKSYELNLVASRLLNEEMQQAALVAKNKVEDLTGRLEKMKLELMNERNQTKNVASQRELCEQAYAAEKQQVQLLKEERNALITRIEEFERMITVEQDYSKKLELLVQDNEVKNAEWREKCSALELKTAQLEKSKVQRNAEMQSMSMKLEKLESKVQNLKSMLSKTQKEKNNALDEKTFLSARLFLLERDMEAREAHRWWKTTGHLVYRSLGSISQMLFPAIPKDVIQNTIWAK